MKSKFFNMHAMKNSFAKVGNCYEQSLFFICLAADLMLSKWSDEYEDVDDFVAYLRNTWIDSSHWRWFEGGSPFPSTNNGLERHNKHIKDAHSLRERVPFREFVQWAEKMVSIDWSRGRQDPLRIELIIMPHLFVDARQMHNTQRKVFDLGNQQRFAIPAGSDLDLDRREIKRLANFINLTQFDSFDSYQAQRFKVSVIMSSIQIITFYV